MPYLKNFKEELINEGKAFLIITYLVDLAEIHDGTQALPA